MGGSLVGLASISGGVSSAIPFDLHVSALKQPLVILLEQDGTDQSGDAGLVGEDTDDVARRLTSLFKRSKELVECNLVRCWAGKVR